METSGVWILDLQLFAEGGEKTEKATPRRRQESRRKGQVFRSVDLNSAVILLVGFAVLHFTTPYMLTGIQGFFSRYLSDRALTQLTPATFHVMLLDAILLMAKISLPVIGAVLVAGLLVNLLQVGFVFAGEPLSIKPERVNPVEGFKRIFSLRALIELVKSVAKVVLTAWVVYSVLKKNLYLFPRFVDMEPVSMVMSLGDIIFEMAMKIGVVLLVVGSLDYLYQWWEHEKSLRMSKEELKQEYKQTEGDPQIRSKQRQKQREMAMRRMMAEVPKADVVITNPTHFAVALKYEAEAMTAPVVTAKGQDFLALRIREVAMEHQVALVENPFLARTIYYSTEIGDPIPETLYQAVAEVLAFVYRQKRNLG
ncbi:MAG: flagellar biosynthesis protein FlhB [Syntrophothermus sp.]|uniref:flagellar biosynthesis protein FlhB n=1 Tax=Syntrophothermus sp. TaxID=2736299 RepID=UPI0025801E7E|nr:flagellar biosynthesis protein FlhB [Syntrophothermus sp.]NSW82425.1 flagellar biosynthesis protein FlhB [Syntrophothermus sp.]